MEQEDYSVASAQCLRVLSKKNPVRSYEENSHFIITDLSHTGGYSQYIVGHGQRHGDLASKTTQPHGPKLTLGPTTQPMFHSICF